MLTVGGTKPFKCYAAMAESRHMDVSVPVGWCLLHGRSCTKMRQWPRCREAEKHFMKAVRRATPKYSTCLPITVDKAMAEIRTRNSHFAGSRQLCCRPTNRQSLRKPPNSGMGEPQSG